MNTNSVVKAQGSCEQKIEFKQAHFKVCPGCSSKKLVKFDMDFFCMDCEWNSILFDVYSGNFEKRIAITNRSRSKDSADVIECGLALVSNLDPGTEPANSSEFGLEETLSKSLRTYETA